MLLHAMNYKTYVLQWPVRVLRSAYHVTVDTVTNVAIARDSTIRYLLCFCFTQFNVLRLIRKGELSIKRPLASVTPNCKSKPISVTVSSVYKNVCLCDARTCHAVQYVCAPGTAQYMAMLNTAYTKLVITSTWYVKCTFPSKYLACNSSTQILLNTIPKFCIRNVIAVRTFTGSTAVNNARDHTRHY